VLDLGAVRKGGNTVISSYYRPVFLALSTLYYQFVGGEPFAWHLAAVLLCAIISMLVCGFFLRLGTTPFLALLVSLVFSFHPSHVGNVAWASGLQDLLAALFVFCALHAILWHRGKAADLMPLAVGSLCFVLALLSKEVAIGLFPLVGIWAWSASKSDPRLSQRLGRATRFFAIITLVYLGVRVAVFHGLTIPYEGAPSFAAALPSVPVAIVTYLRLLVWPNGFGFFRPERPIFEPFAGQVILDVAILAFLFALSGWAILRRPALLLPLAWLIVWLLPVLSLWALDPHDIITDRYLFLPSLALPWVVSLVLPERAAATILALLVVAFGSLSVRYAAIFQDQRVFFSAMEKAEPTSPIVFAEKGRLLMEDGDIPAAQAAFSRAVELDPLAPGALIALADLELREGDLDRAEQLYRQSLVVRPYASRGFKLVAVARSRGGQRQRALSLIEESTRRWPDDFQVELLDAVFPDDAGEHQKAAAAFSAASRLRPNDPALEGGFDAALSRLRRNVEAP
jgi:hypothetical protein